MALDIRGRLRRENRAPARRARVRDAAMLTISVSLGVLLTFLLLSPAGSEVIGVAGYLAGGVLIAIVLTETLVRSPGLLGRLRLRSKLVAAITFATALGLLNTFALSAFMFVNTQHDLPMLFAIVVFAGGVSVYVAYRVAERISRSVESLAAGVEKVSTGRFTARVEDMSGDEFGELSRSFNEMARRLEEAQARQVRLEQERKQFTAALSHDLRTPLSSARVMLEAVRDGVVARPDEQSEYLRRTLAEINNLSDLVDDLFELSLLDAGALKLDMRPTPLQQIVLESVEGLTEAARKKGLDLQVELSDDLGEVVIDGLRVRRVLMNLIQNAIRHTPADGTVTVSACNAGEGEVKVEVKDSGEGIAEEDLDRIWTRSFRADRSRTRGRDGLQQTGLGLSIARGIVELHGGRVSAKSERGRGAEFAFVLPKQVTHTQV